MKLVIVESPAKAKNLSQYLGPSYKVLASYGHIRDLPSKAGSVRPDEDFALTWEVVSKASKALSSIEKEVKKADTLILATDLDREGEAISWHLLQYLKEEGLLNDQVGIQRVSFNAVTKEAVLNALQHPRAIDNHLVEAYLARLSLDYLVGFTLSPVLWRKLPGSRSAGRVQSVALRMVVDREREITNFKVQEYWSIHGLFAQEIPFESYLTHFQGKKLDKMAITNEAQALEWIQQLKAYSYYVEEVQKKRVQRHPLAPFVTSSLQQEASRKLGYSPSRTMQIAQKLYEGVDVHGETLGLITYMRTDSPFIIPSVAQANRTFIEEVWGTPYVASTVRQYKTKKHSQEAHEAIRPTDIQNTPQRLKDVLEPDQWALYKLIWDRTLASQMASAQYDQTTILIQSKGKEHTFRVTGTTLVFDGFLTLYDESQDEEDANASEKPLPLIKEGDTLSLLSLTPQQHFTQPPPRYSEASLIKALEEKGIGRPSTYARILQVLKDRGYVVLEKKRLFPKELGTVVTAFLSKFFSRYVDYGFTANMEDQLDQVSSGDKPWKDVLHEFWPPFEHTIKESQSLKIADVLALIEKDIIGPELRSCPKCHQGILSLRLSKVGPFLACSRYPECSYICSLGEEGSSSGPQVLGHHPDTGEDILLKHGPYGWYIEHGLTRSSLPPSFSPETVTINQALWLLSLPKVLGQHPDTNKDILIGIGRFGPYLKYDNQFFP